MNQRDMEKVIKGAVIAAGGAAVAYLGTLTFDLSSTSGIIASAVAAVAINVIRKLLLAGT